MTIFPAILCGGSGTRLWPLSRAMYPKQFMPIATERTMLQETVSRVVGDGFAPSIAICNEDHRFIVAEQFREAGQAPEEIILEPMARGTAPAAAVAALRALEANKDALVLLLPSDHVVTRPDAFRDAVRVAAQAAEKGYLVTFGIKPSGPETGYGYIKSGGPLAGVDGCLHVDRFVEKPDQAKAKTFLADGGYDWNSGMFLFRADRYMEELERLRPEMAAACRVAMGQNGRERDLDFLRLDADAFAACQSDSIDWAVMEHTDHAAVVPVDMGWSDVGAWSTLWNIGERDGEGNVCKGDVYADDVKGCYLRTEGPMLAAVGLEDTIVVVTDDAVLVAPRARAQDVKSVVTHLEASDRGEHLHHLKVHRPWGWYQNIDKGTRFLVKRICVNPGAKLSLQFHHHRAEHWVVVTGTAHIHRGGERIELSENQSTYIPIGIRHRLENPAEIPLHIIEVQSGEFLDEGDIVRMEDDFSREGDGR